MILNCHDQSCMVSSMKKMTKDNDVIDLIRPVYAKNETELLGYIGRGAIYNENQIGQ